MLSAVVRHVKVVGGGRIFGGHRIDLFHDRAKAKALTQGTYVQLVAVQQLAEYFIREARALAQGQKLRFHSCDWRVGGFDSAHRVSQRDDAVQLLEEPLVDFRQLMDLINRNPLLERLANVVNTRVVGRTEVGLQIEVFRVFPT